jgi:hypothetical protein
MNNCQDQGRVAFLLSDRRQNTYLPALDLESGFVQIAIAVPDIDAMQTLDVTSAISSAIV